MKRRNLSSRVFFIGFLALFLGVSSTLPALNPEKALTQYNVKVWNMADGLPGNSIYAIQQTKDGYLWLGTQDGLVRFDGFNFKVFTKENTPKLKDNEIHALYEGRDGTLWIGTRSGGLTCCKEGEFSNYSIENHPYLYWIRAIDKDNSGNLWVGCFGEGLTCLNNDTFTTYTKDHGLPDNKVRAIYKDGNGDLWVTTTGGIVKMLEPGRFEPHQDQEIMPRLKTACLYKESTSELWVGAGKTLFRFKNGIPMRDGVEKELPSHHTNILFEDKDENLWIGTDGGGLSRISNGKLDTLGGNDALADSRIYAICEDREGSLWVGTVGAGLHQLRDGKFTTYTTREGLAHDETLCVHESGPNGLWIGTKGGLNRLKEGVLTTELTKGTGLLDNNVICLFEAPSGELWIGTWKGLHRFKDEKLTTFTKDDGLSDVRIMCILGDRQGNIRIGTQNGLNRFNNKDGTFTVFTTNHGLLSNIVNFIFKDREGNLWIGTDAGLNRLNNGSFTAYNPSTGTGDRSFRCAYQDDEGVLWFGTSNGLVRLHEKDMTLYTTECGLNENKINSILEDEKGYLWLAGHNGISRVEKKELEDFRKKKIDKIQPERFNEKDGMKSRRCEGAGCKTRDGRFWFPTMVGIAMIDPNKTEPESFAPINIIEKVIVDGMALNTHPKTTEAKPRELAPGKKWLRFSYTGVSFINPQLIQFKVKLTLKGQDGNWIEMGTARSTTYTGLSPGYYTFNMTSRNSGGTWGEKGALFYFRLKPYFTQTTWFYVFVVLAILLLIFSGYRFRVRRLKSRARELKTMVKNRTMELETTHLELRESKEIIEEKSRNTTASIRYARKIQFTMLPMKEKMETHFKDSFVLYLPKDIVSGDFYWFDIIKGHYYIVLADCTGHGVPGALLSMVGYMMLNEVLHGRRISDPAKILARLHQGFRYVLKQEVEDADTYDGMDVGLCRVDIQKGKITYAGARRPLYYVKGSEFVEIKGDRKSIGGRQRERKHVFTNHEIDIPGNNGDGLMLYLTTDGYADQNNPGNEKYGSRRLKQFLRDNAHLSPVQQKNALIKELKDHRLDEEQRDDISIIGMRIP